MIRPEQIRVGEPAASEAGRAACGPPPSIAHTFYGPDTIVAARGRRRPGPVSARVLGPRRAPARRRGRADGRRAGAWPTQPRRAPEAAARQPSRRAVARGRLRESRDRALRQAAAVAAVLTLPVGWPSRDAAAADPEHARALQRPAPAAHERAASQAFTRQTGIHVNVRTGDGIVLADQILQEGGSSPADVYLTENSPELMNLEAHGLLAKLPSVDPRPDPGPRTTRPPASGSASPCESRALAYDPARLSPSQLPPSVLDLAQPQWKGRIAIAPTDSDFPPVVGAVIAADGKAAAARWLAGLKRNAQIYQDDEAVVAAVNRGDVAAGIVNQYYWYRLRLGARPGRDPQPALLLPQPRRRLDREHLRRRRARLQPAQAAGRALRPVPGQPRRADASWPTATTSSTRPAQASPRTPSFPHSPRSPRPRCRRRRWAPIRRRRS